ncbi:MAG: NADH dehydrogenase (quinone) subunit D [candidate division Zixibacteria bacterium]|nr:NADH dehydrogenase (quinone) subunit D [candidate division Zixibacteria bacterium]
MTLNMGPQHPSTHGVLRLVLELDGETVVSCKPILGYLHTGIEKEMETKLYYKSLPMTDRMDYMSPMSNNLGFCLAVEKLLGIEEEIPARAKWVRVLMAEMTRINSHLVWLGTHALDLGAMSMFFYTFRDRELILDMYEMLSGQRMMATYFRIGGLMLDVPKGFDKAVRKFIKYQPGRIDEFEDLLNNNRIWQMRTMGVAKISAEDAINCGLTGPSLRGSGVKYDVRKAFPYSDYDKFDFQVPIGKSGDVYSRYLVRMFEMRESLKIAEQAIDGLPEGSHIAHVPGVVLPPREDMLGKMESLIYHFKIITDGFKVPRGSVYVPVESGKGEMGFFIDSDGTNIPNRVRVRPPSFVNLSALAKLVKGRLLADVVAAIGSIDIVLGEVDR